MYHWALTSLKSVLYVVWHLFGPVRYKSCTLDEVDPYKKPDDLLEVSPKGLVPALKFNSFNPPRSLNESTVIIEYLLEYGQILLEVLKFRQILVV
jgi:glutathione S-transferase